MQKMKAPTLMIQGTTSDAGKSLVAAALCRILSNKGFRVAPFKGQNMALNSFATIDGGEIGRAQALQAQAARVEPTVDMNPVLLKPTGNAKSQVIVKGKVLKTLTAREYYSEKKALVSEVQNSLNVLREQYDIVIIEGAGSPAEINLKHDDIANMGVAKMANSPVLLVGDIDRGGVFASLVGTMELLEDDERSLVKGLIINKFRGDETLLDPGIEFLKNRVGVPFLGTIPYIADLKIDSEDSLALDKANYKNASDMSELGSRNLIDIAVIRLDRISNFTDFDVLTHQPGVNLRYVNPGSSIGNTDCVIIPGTKNTIADLQNLIETGIASEIVALRYKGVPVIGICGGYQMLGRIINDPYKMESDVTQIEGLGLLDCETILTRNKIIEQAEALIVRKSIDNTQNPVSDNQFLSRIIGETIKGYEIHMGETVTEPGSNPVMEITRRGRKTFTGDDFKNNIISTISEDGLVLGTYLHGLFDNDNLRKAFIDYLAQKKGIGIGLGSGLAKGAEQDSSMFASYNYDDFKQTQIEKLAKTVEDSLDIDYIFTLLGLTELIGAKA